MKASSNRVACGVTCRVPELSLGFVLSPVSLPQMVRFPFVKQDQSISIIMGVTALATVVMVSHSC